eukprot:PITA_06118
MPRGKKMQTPSKQPEISSMTHEEEEEILHDISKLQDQVQQISLSQKLTEAKINGVESKIKGVEAKIDDLKIDLKTDLTNFLQDILTNGYNRKFVKNYGRIAAPLTTLLKKDAFSWTPEATKAFEHLQEAMCQAPVLATPDFTKTSIVECDASGNGIGVVLMQDERPIAFQSRPIKGKFLHKAIYENEMLAILHALKKCRPYLMG